MTDNYHFIGIGGVGMSALAHILIQKGIRVSGSDMASSFTTEKLQQAGAKIYIGHAKDNLPSSGRVVYTSDLALTNAEYAQALERGMPMLHRSQLLKEVIEGSQALLVAGTHGKTTTSSLLAHLLLFCQLEPSFAIGGTLANTDSNGRHGKGAYFVAEADESDGSFLQYSGYGAIITNIDNDHLEFWKSEESLLKGFKDFSDHITSSSHLFWCKEDDRLASLKLNGVSYGFSKESDLYISRFKQTGWVTTFDCHFQGEEYLNIEIPMIGRYNVLNAAAVLGLALSFNIREADIRKAFTTFRGVGRRVEKKGELRGVSFYDDYGHHPTEIFVTLHALKKAIGNRRLVVAFQPHRYTRTRDCIDQFPEVFNEADLLFLTEIYSAREAPIEGVTSNVLFEKIQAKASTQLFYATRLELSMKLANTLQPQDVLLTMGAGDITSVSQEILKIWNKRSNEEEVTLS